MPRLNEIELKSVPAQDATILVVDAAGNEKRIPWESAIGQSGVEPLGDAVEEVTVVFPNPFSVAPTDFDASVYNIVDAAPDFILAKPKPLSVTTTQMVYLLSLPTTGTNYKLRWSAKL